ncbi:S1 RNA-binding domain-containing protein [Streptomyces gardneri]|uniref:S1 RNA-binding domain-containing protein n=1 Tax=Nocardia sputi TaxID=2943705 RepID=UPI0018960544|nr:S1 RNA-binding domain-containing protein [Nocardia sputi]MBF6166194.1 S1 RNA-binding domain-containing protein [Streptomyces gardneri]MBF6205617.1 S1 RNA-binding domain-containing protein [Streptomyces gardneri]
MSPSETPQQRGWPDFVAAHAQGGVLEATVVEIVPFGAFLEVAPGIHGLLHRTEWSTEPQIGATLTVRILDIDTERQRVALAHAE